MLLLALFQSVLRGGFIITGAVPSQSSPRIPLPDPTLEHPHPRPCKLLLCGPEHAGQGQVAGALLKLLQGVQVHTVSLPVLVVGCSGDAAAGLVQLLEEALRRYTCTHSIISVQKGCTAGSLTSRHPYKQESIQGNATAMLHVVADFPIVINLYTELPIELHSLCIDTLHCSNYSSYVLSP